MNARDHPHAIGSCNAWFSSCACV
uniref:Uncharacterized protein n=1 Tax=Malus domestica TaxID=3750 RepID=E4Z8M3_MALDO|nr:hypothetical protein [Malus domestica]